VEAAVLPVSFNMERVADLLPELEPLMSAHWNEASEFASSHPFSPDVATYAALDRVDALRVFTLRCDATKQLVGYSIAIVSRHPNCDIRKADQVGFYIKPSHRRGRIATKLLAYMEHQLAAEGVRFVTQNTSPQLDFSKVLTRVGYRLLEQTYIKELTPIGD